MSCSRTHLSRFLKQLNATSAKACWKGIQGSVELPVLRTTHTLHTKKHRYGLPAFRRKFTSPAAFSDSLSDTLDLKDAPTESFWICERCQHANPEPYVRTNVSARRLVPNRLFCQETDRSRPDEAFRTVNCASSECIKLPENCQRLCQFSVLCVNTESAEDIGGLFNIDPIQFCIPLQAIKKAYLYWQNLCHPDRYGGADESIQRDAAHFSAMISSCYSKINDPLKWARLMINDLKSKEQVADGCDVSETVTDNQALFVEIFQIESQAEVATTASTLELLHRDVSDKLKTSLGELEKSLIGKDVIMAEALLERCNMLNNQKRKLEQNAHMRPLHLLEDFRKYSLTRRRSTSVETQTTTHAIKE